MWPFREKKEWDGTERESRRRAQPFRSGNPIRFFCISRMRQRLVIYFLLVALVCLSMGVHLIYQVGSQRFQQQIAESIPETDISGRQSGESVNLSFVLHRIQFRMTVILAIVGISLVVALLVVIRTIVEPLEAMAASVQRIADGNLDETVPVRRHDEIGTIGELINDLSINLQEVLLHVWNHTRQDLVLLDQIGAIIHAQSCDIFPVKLKEQFAFVQRDIEDMQEIVKAFDYYHIRFEGDRLVDDAPSSAACSSGKHETEKTPQNNQNKGSAGGEPTVSGHGNRFIGVGYDDG